MIAAFADGVADMGLRVGYIVVALLALAAVDAAAVATAAQPRRIASLNLCTDQLLLMLVPRSRIVSVTDWAVRPESSYMAKAARGLPLNRGLAEGVLPLDPDLIIAGQFNDAAMLALLRRLGYRVEVVSVPRNLNEARAYILHFGELVGEPEAARALVRDMDERLARIARRVRDLPAPLAAVYAPNGVTVGRDTVLDDILTHAGFRNLAAEQGVVGYGQFSLEQLLAAQPQWLVLDVTADDAAGDSIAHRYLEHPALQALVRRAQVVVMPPRLSECVGPMTVAAIEMLVARR